MPAYTPESKYTITERLKVFKDDFPGYKAIINGNEVPVMMSTDEFILLPLKIDSCYTGSIMLVLAHLKHEQQCALALACNYC